jgi:hypothetical protein
MALVWASLALAIVLVTTGAVVVFRSALGLWRDFKRRSKALADGIDGLSDSLERMSARADRLDDATGKLEPSLTRLRADLSELAVLRAAVRDVQDAVGRVTAVYPSK